MNKYSDTSQVVIAVLPMSSVLNFLAVEDEIQYICRVKLLRKKRTTYQPLNKRLALLCFAVVWQPVP